MLGKIVTESAGGLGWIIFDHEARRNAITAEMWRQIPDAVERLDKDPDVRVVILRGAGTVAFVSGADISEFSGTRFGAAAEEYDRQNMAAFESLLGMTKPTIAMIHGFCVGGGCALALTTDLRYADEAAVFGIPAARLGLGYGAAGLDNLVRVVGYAAAKEIFFSARLFDATNATRLGLVNQILPRADLEPFVRSLAEDIASNAPLTLRSAKLVFKQLVMPAARQDREAIAASVRACYASEDYAEGVRAFLEKRRPIFRGR